MVLAASVCLLGCQHQAEAPQDPYAVTLEQARQVAEHLVNSDAAANTNTLKTVITHYVLTAEQRPALYVFNYQGGGFSIISADKHLMPVLAYSTTSSYTNDNKPGGLLKWEQKTAQCVADAHSATTPLPAEMITREWEFVLNPAITNRRIRTVTKNASGNTTSPTNRPLPPPDPPQDYQYTVGPLVPVTWGQGCSYNNLYPTGSSACGHKWTGCVMTAMAQVMAYWRYPNTYDWANMPTAYGNSEVQRLMIDAGRTIPSIDYKKDDGTGANLSDVAGVGVLGHTISPAAGLKSDNFHYSSANYVNYDAIVVRNNIESHLPVILGGCDDRTNRFLGMLYTYDGCHAWVCDGYQQIGSYFQDQNGNYALNLYEYFHMNWGWHETYTVVGSSNGIPDYSGWYSAYNWNIPGRNKNYQYANDAVVDIHP